MDYPAAYAYITAIVLAWSVAHLIKYALALRARQSQGIAKHLFLSGGMPSGHSSVVTAVSLLIGLREGFDSPLFGLALVFLIIVAYDAMNVRRMAGQTAEVVADQLKGHKASSLKPPMLARGHTPLEVLAGVALGTAIALVVFLTTK